MKVKKLVSVLLTMAMMVSLLTFPVSAASTKNEAEPNNTRSQADRTYNDYSNYGSINPAGDEDWWVVKFTSSGSGSFWLGDIPAGHDFDLRVCDSSGNVIAKSINNSNAQEYVCIDVVANTDYYIRVYGNGTASSSRYQMRAKLYSWRDVNTPLYEQNDYDTCGAANMRMTLASYNINVTEKAIRDRATNMYGAGAFKNQELIDNILNLYLSDYSNSTRYKFNKVIDISDSSYWSKITSNINSNKPMIVMLAYDDDCYFPNSSAGHYVTIRSYSPNSQTKQVRINDSTKDIPRIRGIPLKDLNYYTAYPSGNCYFITVNW